MYAWSKVHQSDILKKINRDWINLLNNESKKEGAYQKYLSNHAGFFFPFDDTLIDHIVIEKLKFGADYISDFIICENQRSYGFKYTLVEIESPHDQVYTKGGIPSTHLNQAMQQIRDWKKWIDSNREEAKRIFPSKQFSVKNIPNFNYLIIIGRRDKNKDYQDKISQLSFDNNIEIRSYDYLTDILIKKRFSSFLWISQDILGPTKQENNDFSNPFYLPYSDRIWRKIVSSNNFINSHIVGNNIKQFLKYRKYNNHLLSNFKEELKKNDHIIEDWEYDLLNFT